METVKATLKIGNQTVTFEGPRDFVDQQVAKYTLGNLSKGHEDKPDKDYSTKDDSTRPIRERDLYLEKKPLNHPEAVAVLAFCLKEGGVEEFTDEDIRKAYLRAGARPPKVVSQAIRDSKNNFDFIESGSGKGTYRLSHHGERTVRFDLPHNS